MKIYKHEYDVKQHPDVNALNLVYKVLRDCGHSDQEAIDICAEIGNEHVVFRMAPWFVEEYVNATEV